MFIPVMINFSLQAVFALLISIRSVTKNPFNVAVHTLVGNVPLLSENVSRKLNLSSIYTQQP